jgi:hypothetical protein
MPHALTDILMLVFQPPVSENFSALTRPIAVILLTGLRALRSKIPCSLLQESLIRQRFVLLGKPGDRHQHGKRRFDNVWQVIDEPT